MIVKLFEEVQKLDESGTQMGTLKFDGMQLYIKGGDGPVVPIRIAIGEGDLKAVLNGFEIKVAYNTNDNRPY